MVYKLEFDLQDTMCWVRKRLVDFSAAKTELFTFYDSNNCGSMYIKMYRSLYDEISFKICFNQLFGCPKFSLGPLTREGITHLVWITAYDLFWPKGQEEPHTVSIAKSFLKKIGALLHSVSFISFQVLLYLCKFTVWLCMEYCCDVWVFTST